MVLFFFTGLGGWGVHWNFLLLIYFCWILNYLLIDWLIDVLIDWFIYLEIYLLINLFIYSLKYQYCIIWWDSWMKWEKRIGIFINLSLSFWKYSNAEIVWCKAGSECFLYLWGFFSSFRNFIFRGKHN